MVRVSETHLRKGCQQILNERAKDSRIINIRHDSFFGSAKNMDSADEAHNDRFSFFGWNTDDSSSAERANGDNPLTMTIKVPKELPVSLRSTDHIIKTAKMLGSGTSCIILALEGISTPSCCQQAKDEGAKARKETALVRKTEQEFKYSSLYHDLRTQNGKNLYAVKMLQPGLYHKSSVHFVQGLINLAMEAKYLSALKHPHIIGISAIADVEECSKDFFFVVDRLMLTLEDKIMIWRKLRGRCHNKNALMGEKLNIAYNICSALEYLHSKKIVYRDLKPNKIGFDYKGYLKLFDFGLATEMTEKRRHKNTNTFNLSKRTGTPKYMAPEVYLELPYNEKCDVYSFALLLWHCLECRRPFESYGEVRMELLVYQGNEMPPFNTEWSMSLRSLLVQCLRRDFHNRYSFGQIMSHLNETRKGIV